MSFTLREATNADISAMAHIQTVLNPNHPYTAEAFAREMKEAREHPLGLHDAYWVAEIEGSVVAYVNIEQYAGMYHADRYHVWVQVLPKACQQGIGTALIETVKGHLESRQAREIHSGAYETDQVAPVLFARYGFEEVQRYFDSHLDVTQFDLSAWQEHMNLPAGYQMVSVTEWIKQSGLEKAHQDYFELLCITLVDIPSPAERTLPTWEKFQKRLDDPQFCADMVLFAVSPQQQLVGFSELWLWENEDKRRKIGITCVHQDFRRKGLALALKLKGIQVAQQLGVERITTNAESNNQPMLTLNKRLGFKNDTAFVAYKWGNID